LVRLDARASAVETSYLLSTDRTSRSGIWPAAVALDHAQPEDDFRPLFAEVERLLVTGDPAIRDLVIVGFLEALQNQARQSAAKWRPRLQSESTRAWDALDQFWAGRISGADFRRLIEGGS
jgi:hypothetical protein